MDAVDDTKLLMHWMNLLAYLCACEACTRGRRVDVVHTHVTYTEVTPVHT